MNSSAHPGPSNQPSTSGTSNNDKSNKPDKVYGPTISDRTMLKIMQHACGSVCLSHGFDSSTTYALEVLSNLATMHMNEICRRTKLLLENAGRTIPAAYDIQLAHNQMGINADELDAYAAQIIHDGPQALPELRPGNPSQHPPLLRIGEPAPRPSHIPSFLPPFPDPHTYIRSDITLEPDMSYSRFRELSAKNKRNFDSSLINFMTTKYPTISLFREYESRLRKEAKEELERQKERRSQLIETRYHAHHKKKLEEEMSSSRLNGNSLPDDLLENGDDKGNASTAPNGSDSTVREEIIRTIDMEEMFELKETENSLIRKKLKPHYQIFLPFEDDRPYLMALLPSGGSSDEPTLSLVSAPTRETPSS